MAWVNQRLTSILYGAGAGVSVPLLVDVPNTWLVVIFCLGGLLTELYQGVRG